MSCSWTDKLNNLIWQYYKIKLHTDLIPMSRIEKHFKRCSIQKTFMNGIRTCYEWGREGNFLSLKKALVTSNKKNPNHVTS
jgi:hypothetical protein